VHKTITFVLVTLPNIYQFKKFFTHRLSNKLFLIWLLTTPPHFKYVATLPCNLLLMACFADINVSQGNSNIHKVLWDFWCPFNCKFTKESFTVKFFLNRLRFDRSMVTSLWPAFLAHPVYCVSSEIRTLLHSSYCLQL